MDMSMHSSVNALGEPQWDFQIDNKGQLVFIEDELLEERQRAIIASFLQRGTIPQLPDTGVDWVDLISQAKSPSEINSQVIEAIHNNADSYAYLPSYTKQGDKLVVTIKEITT